MRFLFQYLSFTKKRIFLFLCCMGIFLLSFYLYALPFEAVVYPVLLCTALALGYMAFDCIKAYKNVKILKGIKSLDGISSLDFPKSISPCEKELIQIIRLVNKEHDEYIKNSLLKYNDMMEYYTVWAHQIKTPIAVMRLRLQNEDSMLARKLLSELLRIEQYSNMVLAYLRLESESTDYVIEKCDLYEISRNAVKRFASEFINKGLTLSFEKFDESVLTDEKWLQFVVEQILSNALKYTPQGKITISLLPEKTLCISDTGIGISQSDLPRVFEKGYTGINGRLDKTATGIGLYLCKRICSRLGHKIELFSEENKGTTVKIHLKSRKICHE